MAILPMRAYCSRYYTGRREQPQRSALSNSTTRNPSKICTFFPDSRLEYPKNILRNKLGGICGHTVESSCRKLALILPLVVGDELIFDKKNEVEVSEMC